MSINGEKQKKNFKVEINEIKIFTNPPFLSLSGWSLIDSIPFYVFVKFDTDRLFKRSTWQPAKKMKIASETVSKRKHTLQVGNYFERIIIFLLSLSQDFGFEA